MSRSDATEPAGDQPPTLRIVKGDPTPEEVAALVAVVSAMAAGAQSTSAKARPKPEWGAHHRKLRGPHRHRAGAWRASAR
ncbi:MAG: acyl-CoA carboxylase subunit epsilon [Marmoricola sp.]